MSRETPGRQPDNPNLQLLVSLACLLAMAWLWYIYPKEFVFSDPVRYAIKAYELGPDAYWKLSDPRDHRIGLLLIHWLGFRLLGTTETAFFLPQLILLLVVSYLVLRQCTGIYQQLVATFTLLLLLPQSVTIFPDLGVATLMFAAALSMAQRQNPWRGVGFAFLVFASLLFKLTAYWLVFPFLYFLICDVVLHKTNQRYFIGAFLSGVALLVGYAAFNFYMFGDPLVRIRAISTSAGAHLWAAKSNADILQRISTDALKAFGAYFGPAFFLALIGAVGAHRRHRPLAVYFWSALVLFTFGSVSLTAYQPLPLFDRMMAPLVPLVALFAAKAAPAIIREMSDNAVSLKRAILTVVFLSVGVSAAGELYSNYSRAKTSQRHTALTEAASILMADGDAVLVLAEPRTKVYFRSYLGFSRAFDARVMVCPETDLIQNTRTTIFYIDIKRVSFMKRAYDSRICPEQTRNQAESAGVNVLYDDASIFLGVAGKQPGQGRDLRPDQTP